MTSDFPVVFALYPDVTQLDSPALWRCSRGCRRRASCWRAGQLWLQRRDGR